MFLPDIESRYFNLLSWFNKLKPIGSLSIDDFRNDFEINVIGAVKVIQNTYPLYEKEPTSIVLFSTVAVNQGMPFHVSIATQKAG
jgi:NAD(P)-dependent dehydrogenase (short-subunit alcohol dehydrogenase family)